MPTRRPLVIGFVAIVVLVAGLLIALWPGLVRAEPANPANVRIQSYGPGTNACNSHGMRFPRSVLGLCYTVYSGWVESSSPETVPSAI